MVKAFRQVYYQVAPQSRTIYCRNRKQTAFNVYRLRFRTALDYLQRILTVPLRHYVRESYVGGNIGDYTLNVYRCRTFFYCKQVNVVAESQFHRCVPTADVYAL